MNLPNVFQNNNIKYEDNSQDLFYSKNNTNTNTNTRKQPTKVDINTQIKNIFSSTSYVYKINVIITTTSKTFETTIIGKSNNYLITINNELISIKDIIDIKEKKD